MRPYISCMALSIACFALMTLGADGQETGFLGQIFIVPDPTGLPSGELQTELTTLLNALDGVKLGDLGPLQQKLRTCAHLLPNHKNESAVQNALINRLRKINIPVIDLEGLKAGWQTNVTHARQLEKFRDIDKEVEAEWYGFFTHRLLFKVSYPVFGTGFLEVTLSDKLRGTKLPWEQLGNIQDLLEQAVTAIQKELLQFKDTVRIEAGEFKEALLNQIEDRFRHLEIAGKIRSWRSLKRTAYCLSIEVTSQCLQEELQRLLRADRAITNLSMPGVLYLLAQNPLPNKIQWNFELPDEPDVDLSQLKESVNTLYEKTEGNRPVLLSPHLSLENRLDTLWRDIQKLYQILGYEMNSAKRAKEPSKAREQMNEYVNSLRKIIGA